MVYRLNCYRKGAFDETYLGTYLVSQNFLTQRFPKWLRKELNMAAAYIYINGRRYIRQKRNFRERINPLDNCISLITYIDRIQMLVFGEYLLKHVGPQSGLNFKYHIGLKTEIKSKGYKKELKLTFETRSSRLLVLKVNF